MEFSDKLVVNGVDLVNRHELSQYQDIILQRFIDENKHILSIKEREKPEPKVTRLTSPSKYNTITKNIDRSASPAVGYQKLDTYIKLGQSKGQDAADIDVVPKPIVPENPNLEKWNYTDDFPGLEYMSSDNDWLASLPRNVSIHNLNADRIPVGSGRNSAASSMFSSRIARGTSRDTSPYAPYMSNGGTYPTHGGSNAPNKNAASSPNYSTYHADYNSYQNYPKAYSYAGSTHDTIPRAGSKPPPSPYNSLKRKGVSWLDQERARSMSPLHQQINSTGNRDQPSRYRSFQEETRYHH